MVTNFIWLFNLVDDPIEFCCCLFLFFREDLLFFPEMTCFSPLQLPVLPLLSAHDLTTYSAENKEEPSAITFRSHLLCPPSNVHLACALLLCSSFFLGFVPPPQRPVHPPGIWIPSPDTFFREFLFYSLFSTHCYFPPS